MLDPPHNNRSRITPEHKNVGFAIAQQPFFRRQIERGVCTRIIDKAHTPPHKTHYWDISHFLHLSKSFTDADDCRHEGSGACSASWRQCSGRYQRWHKRACIYLAVCPLFYAREVSAAGCASLNSSRQPTFSQTASYSTVTSVPSSKTQGFSSLPRPGRSGMLNMPFTGWSSYLHRRLL